MTSYVTVNHRRAPRLALGGALWALQVLWGFFFAGSGFGKVLLYDAALYERAPRAVAWYAAVPRPLVVLIGALEVLGGLGLILPALTRVRPLLAPLAAAGLALTMVLAAGFHVVRGELALVPATVVLGAGAAFLAVGRARLRPLAPAPLTSRRALAASVAVALLVLLAIIPTWYSTTHARF